jgi:hypothetical protein
LNFENASPDVVRLWIQVNERDLLLGRLDPFQHKTFPVRRGMIPPGSGRARLVVIPIGAPGTIKAEPATDTAVRSEFYPANELLDHRWRYSGSRVVTTGLLPQRLLTISWKEAVDDQAIAHIRGVGGRPNPL